MQNLLFDDPIAQIPWNNMLPAHSVEQGDDEEPLQCGEAPVTALPEKLASRLISLTETYPEVEFLLEKEGVGCISVGDIVVLKGKAKAGKTTAMICIVTALLKGEYLGFRSLRQGARVLFVDTEQNPINTSILAKKVHSLCGFYTGLDHPRFNLFNFRSDSPVERCNLLSEAVKFFKPDLLVIDGAKDLIDSGDINDPKACNKSIQFLMSLTKNHNLAILTTLHENKADANLRGHVGTELLNKCSECWQVKKNDDVFETEQTECRNEPAGGFSFSFNEEKLPVQAEHRPKKSPTELVDERIRQNFALCLPKGTPVRYSDLRNKYMETAGCSESSTDNHIKRALTKGYLKKDRNGNYYFSYPNS